MNSLIIDIPISVVISFFSVLLIKVISKQRSENIKYNDEDHHPSRRFDLVYFLLMFVLNIAAVIMLFFFYKDNSRLFLIKHLTIMSILWCAAYFDLKSYIIPNALIIIGLILRALLLAFEYIYEKDGLLMEVIEQLIIAAVLVVGGIICSLVIKNGIGMGDVKLFAIMGLYFGAMGSITAIFLSLIVSLIVSVALIITKKKGKKDPVPFAPSALIGTYIAVIVFGV